MIKRIATAGLIAAIPLTMMGVAPASAANLRSNGCSTLSGHLHATVTVTNTRGTKWYYTRMVYSSATRSYHQSRLGPDVNWSIQSIVIKDYANSYTIKGASGWREFQSNGNNAVKATVTWYGTNGIRAFKTSCSTNYMVV